MTGDSFLECAEKKKFSFCFGLADSCEMRIFKCFQQISSITVNLHSNHFVFSIDMYLSCFGTIIFSIIAIIVSLHQRNTRIKVRDHQFVCRFHRFSSRLLRGRKKN